MGSRGMGQVLLLLCWECDGAGDAIKSEWVQLSYHAGILPASLLTDDLAKR